MVLTYLGHLIEVSSKWGDSQETKVMGEISIWLVAM